MKVTMKARSVGIVLKVLIGNITKYDKINFLGELRVRHTTIWHPTTKHRCIIFRIGALRVLGSVAIHI
jgi:hypothetical protein